jgi:poly(3-hydroxybutyrate) depolymerase
MRAPSSSGPGVPVKRWAAAPQPSAGSETHSSSKPRPANQSQICGSRSGADWAAGNGIGGPVFERPAVSQRPAVAGDPPVTLLTWAAPGCLPVVLYRIEGGGHGWPGGPQFLPARAIGPISRYLDATGILLEMVAADS